VGKSHDPRTRFQDDLSELRSATEANQQRLREILQRLDWIQGELDIGRSLVDVVEEESPPRIVELLTRNLAALQGAGTRFRLAEARALVDEGMTMTRVGELFGVTPQRISALLRQAPVPD